MTTAKMRGDVFADIGEPVVMELDVPMPQNGVILNVQAYGICGTDLHVSSDPPVASLRSSFPQRVAKPDPAALHASEKRLGVDR
jgi:hypothetical protein